MKGRDVVTQPGPFERASRLFGRLDNSVRERMQTKRKVEKFC